MKKTSWILIIAMMSMLSFSCQNTDKKDEAKTDEETTEITTLKAFNKKYADLEFEDCNEYAEASKDFMTAYFATMERAAENDEVALKDFMTMEKDMMGEFKKQAENFKEECGEEIKQITKDFVVQMKDHKDIYDQLCKDNTEDSDEEVMAENTEDAEGEEMEQATESKVDPNAKKDQQPKIKNKKLNIKKSEDSDPQEQESGLDM